MDNFIDHIEIHNFKSIRHLEVSGFKRINLFLGRPNVGKSNLLEALGMFGLPYLWNNRTRRLTDLIRVENPRQLFFEGDFEHDCLINIRSRNEKDTKEYCKVEYKQETRELIFDIFVARNYPTMLGRATYSQNEFYRDDSYRVKFSFDEKLRGSYFGTPSRDFISYIKPYIFKTSVGYKDIPIPFLNPPFGENLQSVLELLPKERQQFAQWFGQYGLQLVLEGWALLKSGSERLHTA